LEMGCGRAAEVEWAAAAEEKEEMEMVCGWLDDWVERLGLRGIWGLRAYIYEDTL
jgi:hypothetical protein